MRKQVTVKRGFLSASAATKTEANAELARQIDWACSKQATTIENRFGWIIIVTSDASGFMSTVLKPGELAHGQQKGCFTFSGQVDYLKVLLSARMNAAQNAWTPECDDSAHVEASGLDDTGKAELASWFRFQRNYAALKAQGKSDADAFNMAHGYKAA